MTLLRPTRSRSPGSPPSADWFSDLAHASEISGYVHDVAGTDAASLRDLREAAQVYNAHLPNGPLRDPYVLNGLVAAWQVREWSTVVGPDAMVKLG